VKILAVIYCFPPLLQPAAICYLKLILGLRELGMEVETLEIEPDSFLPPGENLTDSDLEGLVPDDLVRHRVWSPDNHILVRAMKRTVGQLPPFYRLFEPRKRMWIFTAKARLRKLTLDNYDLILTCSQPHANHLIGLDLKQRTGLPWIAYFSDPWIKGPYVEFVNRRIARYHQSLEGKVLDKADRLLYTSQEMLQLCTEDYPDHIRGKSGVLPHAFVPDWYSRGKTSRQGTGKPFRLLHTGHFYGPRSPDPFLRALARIHRHESLIGRLRIDCHGGFPSDSERFVRDEGLEEVVRIRPVVPYRRSLQLMTDYDALLLVDAPLTRTRESVFLPSKLVDYLGSGTPIIALTPLRGSSARVVTTTGGLVCDVADDAEIERLFRRILDGSMLSSPDATEIAKYDFRQVARQFAAHVGLLDSVKPEG